MTEKFEIREYRDEDLPALSVHWKESVKGWPPGFETSGDFSPEAVREWLLRTEYIACWLGWLDDKIVSFLKYARLSHDPEAAYVDLFNAHPDYHGQGYGRRIMTVCIDRGIRDRAKRIDLHTWAANTKAFPLYKKTGFFWRPRTQYVMMYNFLPAVVNNPLVSDFLGDTWWYDALRQPLEIKENDELYEGCSYHKYTFEKDNRTIEVLVDPSTSGVVGIETDDLTVRCDVPGLTHVAGLPQPVRWTFRSGKESPVSINISCRGTQGLDYSLNDEFELKGERVLETEIIPAPDMRPEKTDWYGKPIECKVEIDGVEFEIKPGIRAVRPFSLESFPYPIRMVPGERKNVVVNITSKIQSDAVFEPEFIASGNVSLVETPKPDPVTITAENSFGVPLSLKADPTTGPGEISIGGRLTVGDMQVSIHPLIAHVGIAAHGQPMEIPDDDPEMTTISNGRISVRAKRKSGETTIRFAETRQLLLSIGSEQIGEPFSMDLRGKNYDISVDEGGHCLDLVFTVDSDSFPGISLERRLRLGAGNELQYIVTFHNSGSEPFTGRLRTGLNNWRILGFVIPIRDRVAAGSKDVWLEGNMPLPTDPSEYPEHWVGCLIPGSPDGESITSGILFEGAAQINWEMWGPIALEWTVDDLQPGESFTLPSTRMIFGASHWREIQSAALKGACSQLPMVAREYLHHESPVFVDSQNPTIPFIVVRAAPIAGSVVLRLPDGRTTKVDSDKWNLDQPIEIQTPGIPDDVRGLMAVDYELTAVSVERTGKLPLIVPEPDSNIVINKGREGDYDFFTIDNGCIEFRIAPEFCASCYSISEKSDPDSNLLRTPFPKPGMWVWWNPWFGGVSNFLDLEYQFHQSAFAGDPVRMRWAGYDWEGVRVTATPLRRWRSLKYESLYLTRPGYPVVLNLLRFTETSENSRSFGMESLSFPCPSGDPSAKTETLTEESGTRVRISRSEGGIGSGVGNWVAMYDPDSGKTVGMVVNSGQTYLWDGADSGQAIFWMNHIETIPGKTVEMASMYAIADAPELIEVLSNSFVHWGTVHAAENPLPRELDSQVHAG